MTRSLLPILLFALIVPSLSAQVGTWSEMRHLPTRRQEMPCALLGEKIYVSGGIIAASTNKTEVYDPDTDTWTLAAPLPDARHHHMAAATDDRIYVMGGFKSVIQFDAHDNNWEYDASSNSWTERAPIPVKSGAGAAVAYNGHIYVFGGDNEDGVLADAFRFDPENNSWDTLAPMPTPREHLAAAVLDSLIYVVGGRGTFDAGVALEIYSPAADSWRRAAPLPTERSGLAAAALAGELYVFGGEGGGIHAENEVYDPVGNTWRTAEPMPTPRHGFTACVMDDRIILPGGAVAEGYAPTNVVEVYELQAVTSSMPALLNKHHALFLPDGSLEIRFLLEREMNLEISAYSLDGKRLAHAPGSVYQPGTNISILPMRESPAGIIHYVLSSGDRVYRGSIFRPLRVNR